MIEVGENLKAAREISGVTIEEVSSDIGIPVILLEQIEEGNMGSFKDIFELKNYIRDYAKYLGLNQEEVIDEFNSYLFRFPGGSSGGKYEKIKAQAREHFKSYGVAFTNWNCLTGDAEGKNTKEECFQEFMNTKDGRTSLVLLMHDSNEKTQTVDVLPDIIMQLKNEGYTFKTFYEII